MDSKSFSVVNGEELEYSGMYIANGDINVAKFYDKAVAEGFTLKQGSNTIQLRVNANTIRAAIPGAGLLSTASRYLPTQTLPDSQNGKRQRLPCINVYGHNRYPHGGLPCGYFAFPAAGKNWHLTICLR